MRYLATVVLLGCCSAAMGLTPDDCTFYASFDGTFDAAQSRGSGKASVKGEMPFVPGVRGRGILVGAPGTELSFATKGNLSLEAGSVSLWVQPESWSDSDAAMRYFFGATEAARTTQEDGGTYFSLYRFFSQSTYFLVWDSRGYWRNRDLVTLAPAEPNVVCTLYRRPGKVLAAVMNNSDSPRDVQVTLELDKLGLPGGTAYAVDAWRAAGYKSRDYTINAQGAVIQAPQPLSVAGVHQRIPLTSGRPTVKVGQRNFRVLSLRSEVRRTLP